MTAPRARSGSSPSSPTNSCAARASSSNTPANWPTPRRGCAGTACESHRRATLCGGGHHVTDNKSPGDRLLELVVFAPTGLAVSLVEEFPKFVEKGRHRVEGQVHTARLVGQFAFQMGRRQLEQTIGHFAGHDDASTLEADVAMPAPEAPAPAPRAFGA